MTQPKLTLEQALSLLDQTAAVYKGDRNDHFMLIEAVKILKEALLSKEPQKK